MGHWRQEKASLGEFRHAWKAEQIQREGLLMRLSTLLLHGKDEPTQLKNQLLEQDRQISDLKAKLERAESKVAAKSRQVEAQQDFLDQVLARVQKLEQSDINHRREMDISQSASTKGTRALFGELSQHIQTTLKAVGTTQQDLKGLTAVLRGTDSSQARERIAGRLGRSRSDSTADLAAKVQASKHSILNSLTQAAPEPSSAADLQGVPVSGQPQLNTMSLSGSTPLTLPTTEFSPLSSVTTPYPPLSYFLNLTPMTTSLPSTSPPPTTSLFPQQAQQGSFSGFPLNSASTSTTTTTVLPSSRAFSALPPPVMLSSFGSTAVRLPSMPSYTSYSPYSGVLSSGGLSSSNNFSSFTLTSV